MKTLRDIHKIRGKTVSENALMRLGDIVSSIHTPELVLAICDKFPNPRMRKRRWAAMVNEINKGLHPQIKPHKWTEI